MSDPRLDALAEAARNRGLKLVRSRVRTPGKSGFGKVGLTDSTGTPVIGLDPNGPRATPDDVEKYLRTLEAQDWGASVDAPKPPRAPEKPRSTISGRTRFSERPAQPPLPKPSKRLPPPKIKPLPVTQIRSAKSADASRLSALIKELGHQIDDDQVRSNLAVLKKTGELPLVATVDGSVVGMCGIERQVVIARPYPVGRITNLIVTEEAQGRGIGRMLVEAAERWMRTQGCRLVEVTSNDRLAEAHAFYRHLGYERTSIRFAKAL